MCFRFNPQAAAFTPAGSGLPDPTISDETKPVQIKSWYSCGVEDQKAFNHKKTVRRLAKQLRESYYRMTKVQDETREQEPSKTPTLWGPADSTRSNFSAQPPHGQKIIQATAKASQHCSVWKSLNLNLVSQDPFFASLVDPWLNEYPSLRGVTLNLPGSRNPYITHFPSLFRLPVSLLQYETKVSQRTDPRQKHAPTMIDAYYAHPLILWYREIWNQHCAARNWDLWRNGYRTDWNWASGYFPTSNEKRLKEHYEGSSLVAELGESVAVRVAMLLKGFYKVPVAVGKRFDYWGHIEKPIPLIGRNGKVQSGCQAHYY